MNKPEVPITTAPSDGDLRGPNLEGEHSDLGRRWWDALRQSGQAQFYEPSDWATAEIAVLAIDAFVEQPRASLLGSINELLTRLLATEGDRRRLRVELEKAPAPESEQDAAISHLADFRARFKA